MERHRKANAFPDLGTPGDPRLLDAISRRTPTLAGGSVNHVFGGTILTPKKSAAKPTRSGPLHVTLKTVTDGDETSYKVEISDGWINERIPGVYDPPSNATAVHKPHNILWGDDAVEPNLATDRRQFDIAVGQQVSVVVFVAAEGNIELPDGSESAGPTEIAIEEEDYDSVHYVPPRPVDEDEGAAGEYHYKLAVLRDADDSHSGPWLEYFLSGSHISHFSELPILDNLSAAADNKGRVFKEYDPEANTYVFRVIDTSTGELKTTESEDGIAIRGNGNDHYTEWKDEGASEGVKLEFVDGLRGTGSDQTILLPVVIAGEGITVTKPPGTTKTYVVSKDPSEGWTGDALLRDCDGDPGGDPPTDGSIIFRLSIENGIIIAVNAPVGTGEGQRPLHENIQTKYVQSCHWIDDQDHSHSV